MQYLHSAVVSGLIAALLFTQTAIAQNPSDQASATQAADAAPQSSSSLPVPWGGVNHPPAPQVPGGPLPARIASAHTVLLTNVGITPRLGLDTNQLYNDIHARLAEWGYYQLVSSPQDADLIFQLDEIDPRNGANVTPGTDVYNRTPSFRIVILDAKTSLALWTVTAPIYITGRKTYAHWMDISEEGLITRLKALAQQPVSTGEQAALTQYPPTHRGLLLGLVIGIPAVTGVGIYFIARHSLANMKASQDAFCNANHIPLSECAGG